MRASADGHSSGFGLPTPHSFPVFSAWVDRLRLRYRSVICPFQELLAFVRTGDRVCDVGCGSGQFMRLVRRSAAVEKVIGIEVDLRLVRRAAAAVASDPPGVPSDVCVYDGMHFPETVKDCNLVFLVDVLHHVAEDLQQQFLERLHDVIPAGSRVVLKDIDRASMLVVCNKLHDLLFAGAAGRERSVSEARAMCEQAGFRVVAMFTMRKVVYPHYFLALDKPPAPRELEVRHAPPAL